LESDKLEDQENAGTLELNIMLSKNFSDDKYEYNMKRLMGNGGVYFILHSFILYYIQAVTDQRVFCSQRYGKYL
jgi:hypothetical protein